MKLLKQRLTSPFGKRINPISNIDEFHTGIDLVDDEFENVYCCLDGVVRRSEYGNFGEGYFIQIITEMKDVTFFHNYFHNKENLVKEGDLVHKDKIIARQGATGNVTGRHTHFEIFFREWDLKKEYAKEIIKNVKYEKIGKRVFLEPFEFEKFIEI